jgi:hypothetical protein
VPRGEEGVEASRRRDLSRHGSRWGPRAREWRSGTRAVVVWGRVYVAGRSGRGARVGGWILLFALALPLACGAQTALLGLIYSRA